jgi:predicted PurR-regulated permease PerM
MNTNLNKEEIISIALEVLVKAVVLGVVLFYALSVVKPFIVPVLWGIIIAVSLSPLIIKLNELLKVKKNLIITVITLVMISFLVVPTYILSDSIIDSSHKLVEKLQSGTLSIPAPTQNVKEWPLIGPRAYEIWSDVSTNLTDTIIKAKPTIKEYLPKIASAFGGLLGGVLQFIIALIISAALLINSESTVKVYQSIFKRLVGDKGLQWAKLSTLTIRSVVQGVLGIALIQAIFAFIGLVVIDVPLPWLWAFLVLLVAIVQLPPILILGPIIAYVFSYADTTSATIFTIYSIIVSASDGFLKPIFLGRGVDIPMLVILLGAIGGMILSGVIGLFIGSVGLAIAYKIFILWLEEDINKK